MSWKKAYPILLLGLIYFSSCQDDRRKNIPDVSEIQVEVDIRRFDKDLFACDTNQMETALADLEIRYPDFSTIFFERILRSKDSLVAPQGHPEFVKGFVQFPSVKKLHDTILVVYPNMDDVKKEYQQAFQFYKYYFPDRPVPSVTTYLSEYTIGQFIYKDDAIAVGLDFFLGEDYPYHLHVPQNPNFSAYLTRTFNKEHLVEKSMRLIADDLIGDPKGNRLLDYMIHYGKRLYLLDQLMPLAPDSIRLEMTGTQVEWLNNNEMEMWAHFLKENLLYNGDWIDIRKLVEYSPSSPGMPPEAPGRTANWIGWQIVKSYMRRNPETTLDGLILEKDAQAILDASKYKPKR